MIASRTKQGLQKKKGFFRGQFVPPRERSDSTHLGCDVVRGANARGHVVVGEVGHLVEQAIERVKAMRYAKSKRCVKSHDVLVAIHKKKEREGKHAHAH